MSQGVFHISVHRHGPKSTIIYGQHKFDVHHLAVPQHTVCVLTFRDHEKNMQPCFFWYSDFMSKLDIAE